MSAAAIVTLIAVGLVIVVLAAYLVWAALLLRHVSFTLGTVVAGLRAIAHRTEPLEQAIGEIARDLTDTTDALEDVLARHQQIDDSEREPSSTA